MPLNVQQVNLYGNEYVFMPLTEYNKLLKALKDYDEPNEVTLAAFEEGEKMLLDPDAKRYKSVDDLFADLDAE